MPAPGDVALIFLIAVLASLSALPMFVAAPPASASSPDAVRLSWRVHRLRESPQGVPLVAGAYALALGSWWLAFPHPVTLLLPTVALTGALAEYLFPVTYRLTARGAHADCGLSRLLLEWKDVRRATHGTDGVYLSPLARPSRLDSFRGVRLRYLPGDADHAETVRETVRRLRDLAKEAA